VKTSEAILELINDYLDIEDDDSLPVAQNNPLRARCLRALQDGANWCWTWKNWTWTGNQTEVSLFPNDDYHVILPSTFSKPGEKFVVFSASNKREMFRRDIQTISRLTLTRPRVGTPELYCMSILFDADLGVAYDALNIYPGLPASGQVIIDGFQEKPPVLVDDETILYGDPTGSSFSRFPEPIQRSVLIPYAARKLKGFMGDAREKADEAKIIEAITLAWRSDVPTNRAGRAPRYGRHGRYR
jgi:hypothetical protein